MQNPVPAPRRPYTLTLVAVFCLSLAACGGGGSADTALAEPVALQPDDNSPLMSISAAAPTNTLQVAITIPGYPHKVDVYRPVGATKAIVFLHALGGRTGQLAYDLGLNRLMAAPTAKNVNWEWLTQNGVIAVFPQGLAKPGTTLPTWSNYVFDSGQDDVGFLKALSSHVKSQYGATEVSLAGHSDGGVMTARVWCEATTSYKAFVSLAGPMPSSTYPSPGPTCTPLVPAPYYMLVGGKDTKLGSFAIGKAAPTPEQMAAGLTDSILVSEWHRHEDRSRVVCAEKPLLAYSSVAATGPTWNACSAHIRYTVVANADHPIASLERYAGIRMVDVIAGFVK